MYESKRAHAADAKTVASSTTVVLRSGATPRQELLAPSAIDC